MQTIEFLLNGQKIAYKCANPHEMLIDYLRANGLTGTKEGCKEGDCGACTLLLVEYYNNQFHFKPVNSCITLMPMVHGCAIISVDGVKNHAVQRAMVDCHGSQCGFCTPGFVMSMIGHCANGGGKGKDEIDEALSGNLCRCTGYKPIINATMQAVEQNEKLDENLYMPIKDFAKEAVEAANYLVATTPNVAHEYYNNHHNTRIIAGATDVGLWVNKRHRQFGNILFINHVNDWRNIEDTANEWVIGAGVNANQLLQLWRAQYPGIAELFLRFAGHPVRNAATIGGNIANGSPIGDGAPLYMAMGATITLSNGQYKRIIPLNEFFIEYGKQNIQMGEILTHITIKKPQKHNYIFAHKIAKRRESDISAVMVAMNFTLDNNIISDAKIVYGGMAGTPKHATQTEGALRGKPWNLENLQSAKQYIAQDFQPLSDLRASAEYRLMTAQNLLIKAWYEHHA